MEIGDCNLNDARTIRILSYRILRSSPTNRRRKLNKSNRVGRASRPFCLLSFAYYLSTISFPRLPVPPLQRSSSVYNPKEPTTPKDESLKRDFQRAPFAPTSGNS